MTVISFKLQQTNFVVSKAPFVLFQAFYLAFQSGLSIEVICKKIAIVIFSTTKPRSMDSFLMCRIVLGDFTILCRPFPEARKKFARKVAETQRRVRPGVATSH